MSISTISFNNASRASIMRVQTDLRDALTESTSGRHVDVGRTLGRLTGNAVSLRSQGTSFDRMLETNKLVTQRLGLVDDTLDAIFKGAEGLTNTLIAGLGNADFLRSAAQLAKDGLEQMTGALNLSNSGQFLFAGTQTDLKPMNAFDAPGTLPPAPSANEQLQTSFTDFLSAAGKTRADVTAAELNLYFTTGYPQVDANGPVLDAGGAQIVHRFQKLFEDPAWGGAISNASSDTIMARISKSETIPSSVSANDQAFRDLAAGYAMLSLFATADLNEGARTALASQAGAKLNAGLSKITAMRSDLGNRMARVEAADTSLTQQKDIVAQSLAALEEIDLVEASSQVAALKTQLEVSYRVAGLIREISILDYL